MCVCVCLCVKEESERSLPRCEDGEACSVLLRRYWRPPALVRLCRCSRRTRCDKIASGDRLVELNNRSDLQVRDNITLKVDVNWRDINCFHESCHTYILNTIFPLVLQSGHRMAGVFHQRSASQDRNSVRAHESR